MARTVPVITTQNPGNPVNAALWNSGPKACTDFYLSPPMFRGRQTGSQSGATNTWTAMTLQAVDVDTDSGHSAIQSRYVCQVAGWYWVEGFATWTSGVGANRVDGAIFKNGSLWGGSQQSLIISSSGLIGISASALVSLTVGDYVEMQSRQETGATLSTFVGSDLAPALNALWVHS